MTKEELQKFCHRDKDRYAINRPWSKGEFSFASDGRILVKVPRLPEVEENEKAPNVDAVESNSVGCYFLKEPAAWAKVPVIDYKPEPCPVCAGGTLPVWVCPECYGDGVVTLETRFNDYYGASCKTCHEKGEISNAGKESMATLYKTGIEWVETGCGECCGDGVKWLMEGVVIAGVKINVRYAAWLAELPGAEVGTFSPVEALRFRFDGGEGLLMPMRPDAPGVKQ